MVYREYDPVFDEKEVEKFKFEFVEAMGIVPLTASSSTAQFSTRSFLQDVIPLLTVDKKPSRPGQTGRFACVPSEKASTSSPVPSSKGVNMTAETRDDVFETVLSILKKMDEEWEDADEITPRTWLVADLGLESIDVVVLGTTIQEHYEKSLPFAEFLAEIGEQEVRDIQIDQFVDFVHQHLNATG